MSRKRRFRSYQEFWPSYLKEHSKSETKKFHAIGLIAGILFAVYCFIDRRPFWYPFAFIIGYAFSWYSHFFIEGNKPASFRHPIWSFISEFRMAYLWLT